MGNVGYIDSSGLGHLISAFYTREERGRRIEVAQSKQECSRPDADHKAIHHFRSHG